MSYGRLVDKEERIEAEIAELEAKAGDTVSRPACSLPRHAPS
jgi:ribosomal protein S17